MRSAQPFPAIHLASWAKSHSTGRLFTRTLLHVQRAFLPTPLWDPPWPVDVRDRPQENGMFNWNLSSVLVHSTTQMFKSMELSTPCTRSVGQARIILRKHYNLLCLLYMLWNLLKKMNWGGWLAIRCSERWDTANPSYTLSGLKKMPRSESSQKLVFIIMLPTSTFAKLYAVM